jgi:tRNA-(ms[2]io[6]A)-hydroxylase
LLLNDHAHLERKAAANALALLQRWPEGESSEDWVRAMTGIAKDEVQHLAIVTKLLKKRGSELSKGHVNPYAGALRKCVRVGKGQAEVLDRLLISALIELRSCERFGLLAEVSIDDEIAGLYKGLWRSELGHYREFLGIARQFIGEEATLCRWDKLLDKEAEIITSQPYWVGLHSWV